MQRTMISGLAGLDGAEVLVRGFVVHARVLRRVVFLVVQDRSGSVQVTVERSDAPTGLERVAVEVTPGSAVEIRGVFRLNPHVKAGDLVIGYQSTQEKRIVALARVSKGFGAHDGKEPTIEITPLARVKNGLTYDELAADADVALCDSVAGDPYDPSLPASVDRTKLYDLERILDHSVADEEARKSRPEYENLVLEGMPGAAVACGNGVAAELMATGLFQYVEPNWIVYPLECPNDARFNEQWHHRSNLLQSCLGWDIHTGTPATTVGLCDTGIRTTHNQFGSRAQNVYDAFGGNGNDCNGHGTHVAGTVGGTVLVALS